MNDMRKIYTVLGVAILLTSCATSTRQLKENNTTSTPIEVSMDLTQTADDKVPVMINPERFTKDTVIYRLPKVIQGTYMVSDFGAFIDEFKAFDYNGNEVEVIKMDTNSWSIPRATELDRISYLVNDSFDVELAGNTPFSPAGTNIESNNYVLNLHGFIGYFESLRSRPYILGVKAPGNFLRSSALQSIEESYSEDGQTITTTYFAPRYFDITDNPMMYGDLSVERFEVGNIEIVLSVFAPNKLHSASSLKETMYSMMEAQKRYLGTINSTKRYDIFLYLSEGKETSPQGFGALEHHTSTVVVMPEALPAEALSKSMLDVVAHEFFHIVTPLSVHSEDVHYFDYYNPTFSKHLWMYEGVTEYFAQHFQVYENLVSEDKFFETIINKIDTSKRMDDTMSFTEMSENVLQRPYSSNYYNVYQKGALIGMCLDILLREESEGSRSILSLMKELSEKYGKNNPFNDDQLFDEIASMTYPSVADFFKVYVEGKTPIDYNLFFSKVGLIQKEGEVEGNFILSGGSPIVSGSPDKGIFFTELAEKNTFWAKHGVRANDVIKKVDGQELTIENAQTIFHTVYGWEIGRNIEVVLDRNGEEIVIKTITEKPYTIGTKLVIDPNASEQQNALRNSWLKG